MSLTNETIRELDKRPLALRADYLACTTLIRACDEAIERLEAFTAVAAGRTDVPGLALDRLRTIRNDWATATDELSNQIAG